MTSAFHQLWSPAERRQARTRSRLHGTAQRPRLSVFRSLRYTSAQLIDDDRGWTLWAGTTRQLKEKMTKVEAARHLGQQVAQSARAQGIHAVVFDRGAYRYHGRVEAVAAAARQGGLKV